MKTSILIRTVLSVALGTALVATSLAGRAQQGQDDRAQHGNAAQQDAQDRKEDKKDGKNAKDDDKEQAKSQQQQQQQRQQDQQQQRRLSQQQQQERIREQKQMLAEYNQRIAAQQAVALQNAKQLEQQKRLAHYRYQQAYYEKLRTQQRHLENDRYDYDNDPYYYTPATYRYRRGDRYYETNQYGADQLRQASNSGYHAGYDAGRADREDRWQFDYRGSFAYQDANYGFDGRHVRQEDYNHYFREGFRRGYEDGYYSRRQYGSRVDGSDVLLGTVLSVILGLQPLQ